MTQTNLVNIEHKILFYSRQAQIKKDSARAKQREEELYDKKAEEATKHADKLKQDRERCLDRINGTLDRTSEKGIIDFNIISLFQATTGILTDALRR